jgi:hypothetical protein
MQDLDRLEANYKRMDQRARREMLGLSEVFAAKYPAANASSTSAPRRWYRWLLHQLGH